MSKKEINKRLLPTSSKETRHESKKITDFKLDTPAELIQPPPTLAEPKKKKKKENEETEEKLTTNGQNSWVRGFCSSNKDKDGNVIFGEYLCGFRTCPHPIFKMSRGSTAHGVEHYHNRHSKYSELISQAQNKGKDMVSFAKELLEKENKIELSSQTKLTHYIKKATIAPEKTVRELHWLLCGIKNAWSFNSQSNPMILEHFLQFYQIKYPNRTILAGPLLEGLYKITQEAVALEVKNALFFHLTGDGWTSINQEYFLAITAHYFKDEKMKRVTLGVFQLYGKKTAILLMKSVTETYNKMLPDQSLITSFVVDGGANYNKASETIVDEENVNCFAHTLQIPINKVLSPSKGDNKFHTCVTLVRNLMKKVKYTPSLQEDFKFKSFPLDVCTRWSSTHRMCVQFNKEKLEYFQVVEKLNKFEMEELKLPNWDVLSAICFCLEIFSKFTKFVGAES